jgi:hypothetical protein
MIKKLAAIAFAVAFSLAAYSPADACPGHKDESKVAKKDGDKDKDAKKSKKVADDKKKKTDDKKKKEESGKKVTRK